MLHAVLRPRSTFDRNKKRLKMNTLKTLRIQSGRKQTDVAEEAGISREHLSALENGRHRLVPNRAERLAAIYGVSPADLMGYHMPEDARSMKEEMDSARARFEAREMEYARELQTKQAEIDRISEEVARLQHDLKFTQDVCRRLMKQNNLPEETLSEGENM